MKLTTTAAAFSLAAFVSMPSLAAPVKMTDAQLDMVVAGTDYTCPPPEMAKGNNGWGNGADGINPGSDKGGTAASKVAGLNLSVADKINTNPTTSSGR